MQLIENFPKDKACTNSQRFQIGLKDESKSGLRGSLYVPYKQVPAGTTSIKVTVEFLQDGA